MNTRIKNKHWKQEFDRLFDYGFYRKERRKYVNGVAHARRLYLQSLKRAKKNKRKG